MFEAKQDVRVYDSLLQHMDDNFRLPTLATKRGTEFSQKPVVQIRATHAFIVVLVNCRAVNSFFFHTARLELPACGFDSKLQHTLAMSATCEQLCYQPTE